MMKKIVLLLMVIALLAGMSACGNDNQKPATVPSQSQETLDRPNDGTPVDTTVQEYEEPETEITFTVNDLGDGKGELKNCIGYKATVVVPETVNGLTIVGIGADCFISDVKEVVLPDSVEYIEGLAFNSCKKLRTVKFGSGLKRIGRMAFNICSSLETLSFPEGMEEMELPFLNCGALKEVYIPASVTEIKSGITISTTCPNLVVVTPAGSVAEEVASESGIAVRNP